MDTSTVILAVVLALVLFLLLRPSGKGPIGSFKRQRIMTANELEFFGRLVKALPEHYIFPQVAMLALLEPASKNAKVAYKDRLRIAQQRVDYVVCSGQGDIVAVVELDDRTHSAAKDRVRDRRLEQAGIRTIRFQSKNKPSIEEIIAAVSRANAPTGSNVTSL